jgi:hypothetical protein
MGNTLFWGCVKFEVRTARGRAGAGVSRGAGAVSGRARGAHFTGERACAQTLAGRSSPGAARDAGPCGPRGSPAASKRASGAWHTLGRGRVGRRGAGVGDPDCRRRRSRRAPPPPRPVRHAERRQARTSVHGCNPGARRSAARRRARWRRVTATPAPRSRTSWGSRPWSAAPRRRRRRRGWRYWRSAGAGGAAGCGSARARRGAGGRRRAARGTRGAAPRAPRRPARGSAGRARGRRESAIHPPGRRRHPLWRGASGGRDGRCWAIWGRGAGGGRRYRSSEKWVRGAGGDLCRGAGPTGAAGHPAPRPSPLPPPPRAGAAWARCIPHSCRRRRRPTAAPPRRWGVRAHGAVGGRGAGGRGRGHHSPAGPTPGPGAPRLRPRPAARRTPQAPGAIRRPAGCQSARVKRPQRGQRQATGGGGPRLGLALAVACVRNSAARPYNAPQLGAAPPARARTPECCANWTAERSKPGRATHQQPARPAVARLPAPRRPRPHAASSGTRSAVPAASGPPAAPAPAAAPARGLPMGASTGHAGPGAAAAATRSLTGPSGVSAVPPPAARSPG